MKSSFIIFLYRLPVIILFIFLSLVTEGNAADITLHFTGMSPHLNQTLFLRVVDKGTLKETGRTSKQIVTADFDITIDAATPGRSYFIDFFSDVNSNNLYDSPPADHAWRLELNNAVGGDEMNFSHNTNFTDIRWVYQVVVHFTGMSPHLNQLLELRVEDNTNGKEVDRTKVNSVPSANFDLTITGVELNKEYKVEFYADVNGNGIYDTPPADHAWLITFTNTTGNFSLDFAHNTNFTDINWKYLLTVNFISMSPHINELFELRVVDQNNLHEIGRVTLPAVLVPDFTIYIPEFELNHNYNIDFYADHNGNGIYDAPPVDHAWRLTFISSNGDIIQDFSHNTNFTDINWPNPSAVNEENELPKEFSLYQNYPNPFNPSTKIKFTISEQAPGRQGLLFTTLKVFNIIGKEVAQLINENLPAGTYEINFDAQSLPSGLYFYKLQSGNFSQTRKMIVLK